jgi:hypothetical protein
MAPLPPPRDEPPHPPPPESIGNILSAGMRFIATGLGLVVIVFGLWAALKIFGAVYAVIVAPTGFAGTFKAWVDAVGGAKLDVALPNGTFPLAPLVAALILGGGTFILAWIGLGMMLTGAKIVSWTQGDREAVKRILEYSLGRRRGEG